MTTPSPLLDIRLVGHPVESEPILPFPQPAGAECVFYGRTRTECHPEHGPLDRLSYEAYEPMAEQVLRALAKETAERFDCLAVRVHHALGDVPPGEASVFVQVVTAHRGASFDACRYLMDELKTRVPIWKKEHFADGASWSDGAAVRS